MNAILVWLLPLWYWLSKAKTHGVISFTEVAGVGWQCTIRPESKTWGERRGVNAWLGEGRSLKAALVDAIASTKQSADHTPSTFRPKLGGAEYDDE